MNKQFIKNLANFTLKTVERKSDFEEQLFNKIQGFLNNWEVEILSLKTSLNEFSFPVDKQVQIDEILITIQLKRKKKTK